MFQGDEELESEVVLRDYEWNSREHIAILGTQNSGFGAEGERLNPPGVWAD